MTEQWNKALECGKIIAVLFIDFKKAINVVPHVPVFKYSAEETSSKYGFR